MKNSRIGLFALILCLVVPAVVGASASVGSKVVYPAAAALTIDGFASDWGVAGLEPTLRIDPAFSLVNAGVITNAAESSADVYLLYDDEYVYVVAKVVDDNVVGGAADGSVWSNSGVETWFSLSGSPTDPAHYDGYKDSDYQINFVPHTRGKLAPQGWVYPAIHASHNVSNPLEVAASMWTQGDLKGYIIEGRIPKAKFAGMDQVKAGATLRFAVSLVHNDKNGTWEHIWTPGVAYVELQVK